MAAQPVLITGGAGFIGANLVRTLLQTGKYRVTVLDDLSTGTISNLDGLDVRFIEGSILNPDALDDAVEDSGIIVHLAALGSVPRSVADPVSSHEVNATGTLQVLEAARRCNARQVLFSSSSSVYGDTDAPAKHELLPVGPKSPYGASKLAAEAHMLAYQRTYGLQVLAFRFFNVFGPLQAAGHVYAAVIPAFIDNALRGKPLVVHGDGMQSRDFTYVGTVCATILDAINRSVSFDGPVNLAFGTQIPLMHVIDLLSAEVGFELELDHVESRPGDIRHSKSDSSRLVSLFPDIQPTDVATGIKHTLRWFHEQELPAHQQVAH